MKNVFFAVMALAVSFTETRAADSPAIVPMPQHIAYATGEGAVLSAGSRIAVPGGAKALRSVAELFVRDICREHGLRLKVSGISESGIVLGIDPALRAEAYSLDIGQGRVAVTGGSPSGLFYGLQSLRQLISQYGMRLPAVHVEDEPCFAYRGAMLDCCRHFFTVDELKTFIDILALHKLNRFHWHLTDDQGWRIEIRHYPGLTKEGSRRAETVLGRNTNIYDGIPSGGYYTQRQIRDVVAYAAERFITVIPEIEMPGHASAALAAYPWLGCAGEGYMVRTRWGVFPEVYCAGKDSTFEFMENVLAEVCELFPSEYIHIGGDEADKASWATCPRCRTRMRQEGLEDVDGLQSYLVHRVEVFLNGKGRRLLGWDEILQGGLAPDATVMSWRGSEGGIAAARAGHQAVMTPNSYCYLDYCQDDPTREPAAAAAFVTLEKAYSLDPAPDSLGVDVVPMILGVQGNLWCEHVPTGEHAEHMIWPRLMAIAEVGWSLPERKDYDDFHARVLDAVAWMQERGYHPFDQKNAVGDRPESIEPVLCLSTGKPVVYHTPYSPKYAAVGDGSLTDGLRGDWNYGDGRWQGWLDTDIDLVVDLGECCSVKHIAADFMQGFYADIWMPRAVEISVSNDNKAYTMLATVENDVPFDFRQDCYRTFGWTGESQGRYIRLKAFHNGHPGGWIFTDEIIVE